MAQAQGAVEPKRKRTTPVQFVQQTRAEIAKVVWPSRREVTLTTIMVFLMTVLLSTFFALVDMAIRFGVFDLILQR